MGAAQTLSQLSYSHATSAHNSLDPGEPTVHALGHQVRQIGRLEHPGREGCGRRGAVARPTGVKPTRTHSGLKSIPIEGADDWEVATMHSA